MLFLLLILSSTWALSQEHWAVYLIHMNSKRLFNPQEASDFATSIYMVNLGQIGGLQGYYLFSSTTELIRATAMAMNLSVTGENGLEDEDLELSISSLLMASPVVQWFEKQVVRTRSYRGTRTFHMRHFSSRLSLNDPLFPQQWHLVNDGENALHRGNDIHVMSVWNQSITGKGVTVALIDDGIDVQHADLMASYNPKLSFDFMHQVSNASFKRWNETHGTRCAGEIVAAPNNNMCGVGVAFHANISSLRLIPGESTDAMEAQALNYEWNGNDIYTSSWGPKDDGSELEGPGYLATKAMEVGIQKGRNGKGSIYVFATGNGGDSGDNCNFDGYSNSIYTVTVGSIDHTGQIPHYAEECAAHLAVTYSGGRGLNIITTDINNSCTFDHSGSSASAPLAAGIIALALSIRHDLSWRDIQHLIVSTAKPTDSQDGDWTKNGAGYFVNHKYGFGQMDAFALVESAKHHPLLPLDVLNITKSDYTGARIPFGGKTDAMLVREIQVTSLDVWESGLSVMEHVQVQIRLRHKERRYLTIKLLSPSGTMSVLAVPRVNDDSPDGFNPWTFMTVRNWGESPVGTWKLMIHDARYMDSMDEPIESGDLYSWTLNLHGLCQEHEMEIDSITKHRKCIMKGSSWMVRIGMTIGLALLGLILVIIVSCLCYYRFKRRRDKGYKRIDEEATVKEDIRKKMEKDLQLMKKYQLDISSSSSQMNIARSAAEIEPLSIQPLGLSRSETMKYVPEEPNPLTTKPLPPIQKPLISRFQPVNSEVRLSSNMDNIMFEVKKNAGKPIMTTKIASDVLMARTKQTSDMSRSASFDRNTDSNQSLEYISKADVKVKPRIEPALLVQELQKSTSKTLDNQDPMIIFPLMTEQISNDIMKYEPNLESKKQEATDLKLTETQQSISKASSMNSLASFNNDSKKEEIIQVRPSRSSKPRPTAMLPPSRESLEPIQRSNSLNTTRISQESRVPITKDNDSNPEDELKGKKSRFEKLKRKITKKQPIPMGRSISAPNLKSPDKAFTSINDVSFDSLDNGKKMNLKVDTRFVQNH